MHIQKLKSILVRFPPWIFSIIVITCILWLTLAPRPLGNNPPPLFPGADKIAHALLFGIFAWTLLFDLQRKKDWKKINYLLALIAALISSSLGIIIEYLQQFMQLGRGFEAGDIIADIVGAFLFSGIYLFFQKIWLGSGLK